MAEIIVYNYYCIIIFTSIIVTFILLLLLSLSLKLVSREGMGEN